MRKTFLNWTDEEIARIRDLRAQNKSMVEIARALGRSKPSVIGLAYRMAKRGDPLPELDFTRRPKQVRPERPAKPKKEPPPPPPPAVPVEGGVSLYDLRDGHCRWVTHSVGHVPHFCGADTYRKSYCSDHYARCYTRVPYTKGTPKQHRKQSIFVLRNRSGRA